MSVDDATLIATLAEAVRDIPEGQLAVAISGGGDSTALLHLAVTLRNDIQAVTVDHALRKQSSDEAKAVGTVCANLNILHDILTWKDWDGSGNLQARARNARYRMIEEWAKAKGITHVLIGHTRDDQAETFLMRLSRGSGVDGLSGMAAVRKGQDVTWVRPLLGVGRDDLRSYLLRHGISWIDDPSNDDPKFERIKIRQAMTVLTELGLSAERLSATAAQLSLAREALQLAAVDLAKRSTTVSEAGEVTITRLPFDAAPMELQLRLMSAVLQWMSGEPYRPRLDAVRNLLSGDDKTLSGCQVRLRSGKIIVRRELASVAAPIAHGGCVWDHRWFVEGFAPLGNLRVAALGDVGLEFCKDWKASGHPRETLITTPALWQDDTLIAAPLARMPNNWTCRLINGEKGIHEVLMTR